MKKYLSVIIALTIFVSCTEDNAYYSMEDYTKVKKTDVHIHIMSDRPYFVEKAKADNFHLVNVALEINKGWDDVYIKYNYGKIQKEQNPETVARKYVLAHQSLHL